MQRRSYIQRRTPLRRVNAKRKTLTYERNYGKRGEEIRAMPCLLEATNECSGRVEAAHAEARKMGGRGGDKRSLVPMCTGHHAEQGRGQQSFAAKYKINLRAHAARIADDLDARGIP